MNETEDGWTAAGLFRLSMCCLIPEVRDHFGLGWFPSAKKRAARSGFPVADFLYIVLTPD